MGYAIMMAPCFVCKRVCAFNPIRVPSYQGQPICKSCVTRINEKRKQLGNEEWVIPDDAYEWCREEELGC